MPPLSTQSILAATAVLLWTSVAAAQQQPSERFEEELVVTEVLLDAVVTDRRGSVILGLGKDDFVVREGGREVEILGVSFYSAYERIPDAPLELPGFELSEIPEDRHFILFIQEQSGSSLARVRSRLKRAGEALKDWVSTQLNPADVVAVVSYGRKLKVHLDFSRDRQALLAAIDRAVRGADPASEWPSRRPPESAIGPLLENLPSGKTLRKRSKSLYRGLELLAEAAGAVGGRKNLVFVGTGFGTLDDSDRYRRWKTTEALNAANIAAYTLDLVPSDIEHTSRSSLRELALDTGGRFFFNFVSFSWPLEEIATDTGGYYLIAYRSRHPEGQSGYQRVRVSVANPELRVRARSGYAYGDRGPS